MDTRTNHNRAPLSAAEKKYRRKNELCMYCGESGHKVSDCSSRPTKRQTVADSLDPDTPLPHRDMLRYAHSGILYMMTPFASGSCIDNLFLTVLSYFSPYCATVAVLKPRDKTSEDVGLLTLPRELRNKIYEELLLLDDFQDQEYEIGRKLEPSILGVNKQICSEASEFLYGENGWITVTLPESTKNALYWDQIGSTAGFPGSRQPVTRYENDRLSHSAVLDMKMQQCSDSGARTVDLVISLAAMPRFCRLVTQSSWVSNMNLILQFNCGAKESHQSRLLKCLGQARGFEQVDINNADLPWAALNTALLMMHPYKRMSEILNTVGVYQSSADLELRHGRILSARNLFQDGVHFIDWWLELINAQFARLGTIKDEEMDELLEARADMGFSCASLSLQLGSIELAQRVVKSVLEKLSRNDHLHNTHKASAHYYMAQSFEALGWKNAALYGYLQALTLCTHYRDADDAVDQMERNIGSGMTLEDAKIKHNIEHVVNPFRAQSSRIANVSKREYRRMFREFDGTAAEIRSLNRQSRGEVGGPYRKTSDGLLIMHRPT